MGLLPQFPGESAVTRVTRVSRSWTLKRYWGVLLCAHLQGQKNYLPKYSYLLLLYEISIKKIKLPPITRVRVPVVLVNSLLCYSQGIVGGVRLNSDDG